MTADARLAELLDRYFDEAATSAEIRELGDLLRAHQAARRLFWSAAEFQAQLRAAVQLAHATAATGEESAASESAPATPAFYPALWDSLPSAIDWRTHFGRFLVLVLAITLAAWGGIYLLVRSAAVDQQVADVAEPRPEPGPEPGPESPVARLRQYDGTLWADGTEGIPGIGWGYFAGDTLDLEVGLARFRFQDGAEVLIEGPCQITFEGRNAARLQRGRLAALVEGEAARGFVIDTPFATVTDLGTEFGMAVCEESAEVEVYEGEVRMEAADGGGRKAVQITAGGTARADRAGRLTTGTVGAERLDIVRSIDKRPGEGMVRFQDGVSPHEGYRTEATYIRSGHASRNFNAANQIIVGTTGPRKTGDVLRSLLVFDVSAIPASDRIDSVALVLTTYRERGLDQGGEPGDPTFDVYSYGFDVDQTTATWNAPAAGDATAGGTLAARLTSARFDPTQTGRTVMFGSTAAFRAAVADALAGDGYLRLVLAKRDETTVGTHEFARFAGNSFATAAHRPRLVVIHSAGAAPSPAPSPGAAVTGRREPHAPYFTLPRGGSDAVAAGEGYAQ